ncbi:hypothetical protein [Miltoncostaea marina]|uniref:hypothetical protein n=1 Tax=Miltoncostaea marina TaxID=2843215 RepID=UPI001C3E0363|nr:hypothetical protein [Miltoncostaea marina]
MTVDTQVHSLPLPAGAEPPIRVYVNGEEWTEGRDFRVEGDRIHFSRMLRAQPPLGMGRKIMLAMGIGVYGYLKGDTLDLQYQEGGRTRMTPVRLTPEAAGDPPRA